MFRIPLPLYKRGWGWIFGHAFPLLEHEGRATGRRREPALKVLTYDPRTRESVVFAAWGGNSDWVRNIRAKPATAVRIGREAFAPVQRFLAEEESFRVVADYRRTHPMKLRALEWLMGWDDLRDDSAVRSFVHERPFVSLRPREAHLN